MMGPACVCLTQLVSGQLFHLAGIRDREWWHFLTVALAFATAVNTLPTGRWSNSTKSRSAIANMRALYDVSIRISEIAIAIHSFLGRSRRPGRRT